MVANCAACATLLPATPRCTSFIFNDSPAQGGVRPVPGEDAGAMAWGPSMSQQSYLRGSFKVVINVKGTEFWPYLDPTLTMNGFDWYSILKY
jgi:hypothetical protein